MTIVRLKRGGHLPPRVHCEICGSPDLCARQAFCKKCFSERQKAIRQEKKTKKAIEYGAPIDLIGEEWKDIDGADGYMISSHGRVKCLNYRDQGRPEIMRSRTARKGLYLKIDLDKYDWRPSVHRLVAIHFVPNPQNYPLVLHKDDDKQNNHKDNLEWGTHSKNRKDYIAYTDRVGIKRKEMSKEKVLAIFNSTDTVQEIALQNGIAPATVWMIKSGYRWSSITGLKSLDKRKHEKITEC